MGKYKISLDHFLVPEARGCLNYDRDMSKGHRTQRFPLTKPQIIQASKKMCVCVSYGKRKLRFQIRFRLLINGPENTEIILSDLSGSI